MRVCNSTSSSSLAFVRRFSNWRSAAGRSPNSIRALPTLTPRSFRRSFHIRRSSLSSVRVISWRASLARS